MKPATGVDPRTRRRAPRPAVVPRDTDATAFTLLLADLIGRIPGAHAAALVDRDGESIDYAGTLSPFDIKVAAAHWQIILGELDRVPPLRDPRHVVVRGLQKSFIIRPLADGYSVVLVLSTRGGFAPCTRAYTVFERALHAEAGIGRKAPGPPWTPVLVEHDARCRPRSLRALDAEMPQPTEVLGAVMGLGRGERGFRVRIVTGVETMLVREPGGAWYADEPIDSTGHLRRNR